jgi:hypothetical protein
MQEDRRDKRRRANSEHKTIRTGKMRAASHMPLNMAKLYAPKNSSSPIMRKTILDVPVVGSITQ